MVIGAVDLFVGGFHDRMPILLERDDFARWEEAPAMEAKKLLKPASEDVLQAWPVARKVNSSKADEFDPSLIEKAMPTEMNLTSSVTNGTQTPLLSDRLTPAELEDLRRFGAEVIAAGRKAYRKGPKDKL